MDDKNNHVDKLIKDAWNRGDATAWFESVYARAESGKGVVPWAHMQPNPLLVEWADRLKLTGDGQRALVIGCGLGDDAEELSRRGFTVTAFDISQTAIASCNKRFPESRVDYRVADLFDTPLDWNKGFDFVLESRTIQALPWQLSDAAVAAIAGFVAPTGRLVVLCHGREPHESRHGIPWPLSREELAGFEQHGLVEETFESIGAGASRRFRVVYRA